MTCFLVFLTYKTKSHVKTLSSNNLLGLRLVTQKKKKKNSRAAQC